MLTDGYVLGRWRSTSNSTLSRCVPKKKHHTLCQGCAKHYCIHPCLYAKSLSIRRKGLSSVKRGMSMLTSDKHYKVANSTVAMLRYHLVWSTRRRRDVLRGPVAERLETLLESTAQELGIDIIRLRIEPDYVHMYVTATPNLAPTQIVYRLKNGSAALRDEFDDLKRIPSMWTSACLVSSAPNLRPDEIQLYIQAQSKSA